MLVPCLEVTETRWEATRGLLGRGALAPDAGLLIRGCSSVHTCFMRFAIDLVYLAADDRICRLVPSLRPWRLSVAGGGARSVLELPSGRLARSDFVVGQHVTVMAEGQPRASEPLG